LPLRKGVEPAGESFGHDQVDPDERIVEVHVTNGSLCERRRTPSSNGRRWRGSQLLIGIGYMASSFGNTPERLIKTTKGVFSLHGDTVILSSLSELSTPQAYNTTTPAWVTVRYPRQRTKSPPCADVQADPTPACRPQAHR
jgi:hypothetical protein